MSIVRRIVYIVGDESKMNPREVSDMVLSEARITGCSLITLLTSNRCYICTKDWICDNCYRPLEAHTREIRQRYFGSGSSDGAENGNSEKLSPSKFSEVTSPSPGPSNNSYSLLQNDNMRDDRRTSMEGVRLSDNSGGGGGEGGIIDGSSSRPLSQTSSEMDTLGPLQPVKHREKAKLQRPLTRYLPIKSESLDLRHHIETAGHQLPLIYDVTVDTTSCSGHLSKMSKKFHHWNKRWFVFDRKRKTLSYYSDNTSRKARGVIYFQSIEEVYVDHMNTVRSPHPSLTFIVKTSSRLYHLMAPSPEAMRVWVDVVFTGAEGYHEFDHGV